MGRNSILIYILKYIDRKILEKRDFPCNNI